MLKRFTLNWKRTRFIQKKFRQGLYDCILQNNPFLEFALQNFKCIVYGEYVCMRLPWGIIRNRPCDICSFGGPGEFGGGQIRKRPIRVVSLSAIVNLQIGL